MKEKMKKKISSKITDWNLAIRVRVSPDGEALIEVNKEMWNAPDVWGSLLADVAISISKDYTTESKRKQFVADLEQSFCRDIRDAIQS